MSKIVSLQILRGFAATLVAGFHLYAAAKAEGFAPGLFTFFSGGEIGVDIFFVVSGFIIFYISQNRPGMTRYGFLWSRFWRILPPYWAILSLYILSAVSLAVLFGDQSKLPSFSRLLISYLSLPNPDHVIAIAWTLSLEVVFYIVFSLAYFGSGAFRLISIMALWVLASQVFSFFVADKPTWLLIPLHTVVLEFLFGILIAYYYVSSGKKLRLHLPVFLVGLAGVSLYLVGGGVHVANLGREFSAGVPAALLVYGTLGFSLKEKNMLETWGDSSYILYLFHILYFSVVGKTVEILFGLNIYGSQMGMLAMLISVIMTCYVGTVYLERPYQNWYRRLLKRARSRPLHSNK